jgi:zinc protease
MIAMCLTHSVTSCARQKPPDVTANALAALEKSNTGLHRFVLDNGMVCLVKADRSAPVVSLQIWVGTGSIHEQEFLGSGLSHAIEHMIFKGTDTRGPTDISKEINDAGGDINAYTSLDRTVFHTDLPSRNWRVGLDVLADAVMHAGLPEKEWQQEQQVILREIAMCKDDPGRVLERTLWRTAFTVHPYRFPIIGHEEIFSRVTHSDLVTFFKRNYVPDNMIMVIVGDIDPQEVEASLRDVFKDFLRKSRAPVVLPVEPPQLAPRMERETGAYNVSRSEWAYHTVAMSHPDAPALDVLSQILGEGRSSRLVREIKEKKELVHSISAWSYTPREAGLLGISIVFDPDKEQQVIDAVQAEIDACLQSPFSREEIDKARRMVLTGELADLQTMKGQAGGFAEGEFYAGDPRFSEIYLKQLEAITPAVLQTAARKYLQPENRTVAILSPAKEKKELSSSTDSPVDGKATKVVLPSGVTVIVHEDHRLPFVYFCAALAGGVISEEDSNNGITKLMSELLVKGTRTRSQEQIADEVESRGGTLSAFSGFNSFGLQARCLAADVDFFMDILADCLLNASFPDAEVSKQKVVQLAAIDEEHERPIFMAQEALRELLFSGHPYRLHPLGRKETVNKIARSNLLPHFEKHVRSGNLVFSVFGDITPDQAVQLAKSRLHDIPKGGSPVQMCVKAQPKLPARSERREPREQAIVLAGFPGISVKDQRVDALTLLQYVMNGLSSDLAISVREHRGLAYFVGAYQQIGLEPGAFVLYAGTHEKAVPEVEKLFQNEINRLTTRGIRPDELDRAKNQIIADYEMSLQDNLAVAMNCALDELYGLGYQHAFDTKRRFSAVTAEDVKCAAASLLTTNSVAMSIVLPGKKAQAPQP